MLTSKCVYLSNTLARLETRHVSAEICRCFSFETTKNKIGLIGAPFAKGQSRDGTELAPDLIRKSGLITELQRLGLDIKDYGDCIESDTVTSQSDAIGIRQQTNEIKNSHQVKDAVHRVSQAVQTVLKDNRMPITLGGDHSLGLGTVYGHSLVKPNLCVLWIDAHADINTTASSKTGHFHGMPVSFLIKDLVHSSVAADCFSVKAKNENMSEYLDPINGKISASNFAYIGLRDLDVFEVQLLKTLTPSLTYYSMRDVDKLGIFEVVSRALEAINPQLDRPIHVSFDIDAVDELVVPSTGTSCPGGLTLREALVIGEQVFRTNKLSALDLVEVNPLIGTPNDVKRTVNCAINIILSFLGRQRTDLYARHRDEAFY